MRCKVFTLNEHTEFVSKIVREVLNLFKVEIVGSAGEAEYAQISIINKRLPDGEPRQEGTGLGVRMESKLVLFRPDGSSESFAYSGEGAVDERESAAEHRLIKLNLYHIFRKYLGMPQAPWGILHGVRPTKIVHRWIRGDKVRPFHEGARGEGGRETARLEPGAIVERLMADYACSREKAEIIVPMAYRQLPFLEQSDEKTVSIYVGIPFCLTRCLYCSFPANVLPGEKKLREFMQVFQKDLQAVRESVQHYGFKVQNIYVGGGTPTSLPDVFFAEMLEMVYNAFYGPDIREFTVEAGRPDSITPAKIQTMKEFHVSRVSVNPQTMQQRTLQLIGRRHTPEAIVSMYRALREAGIPHINMDLILGLPGENAEDVRDTLEKVTALEPDDITLHALAIKRGSRLKLIMEERHVDLPNDEETRRMSEVALGFMRRGGWQPYYLYRQGYMSGDLENIGCARPGSEGMYNIQIMEEHQTIIGIGGSATTKVVDKRAGRLKSVFNAKDLTTYMRDIDIYISKRNALLDEVYQQGGSYAYQTSQRH